MELTVDAVWLAVLVAAIYLILIRAIDLNEREPFWAVLTFFGAGVVIGLLTQMIVGSRVLVLELIWGAVALEVAKFVAFGVGFVSVEAVGRRHGWSEFDGILDGIVYGVATGLGVAAGGVVASASVSIDIPLLPVEPVTTLWTVGLFWLVHGLFGALIGVGFGIGRRLRLGAVGTWLLGAAGAIAAMVAHVAHRLLSQPPIDAGGAGLVRRWVALAIPLLLVALMVLYGLLRERRAIAAHLADEPSTVISPRDRNLLASVWARRRHYLGLFWRGELERWLSERRVHNRLVRLAVINAEASAATSERLEDVLTAEAEAVRAAVVAERARMAEGGRHLAVDGD